MGTTASMYKANATPHYTTRALTPCSVQTTVLEFFSFTTPNFFSNNETNETKCLSKCSPTPVSVQCETSHLVEEEVAPAPAPDLLTFPFPALLENDHAAMDANAQYDEDDDAVEAVVLADYIAPLSDEQSKAKIAPVETSSVKSPFEQAVNMWKLLIKDTVLIEFDQLGTQVPPTIITTSAEMKTSFAALAQFKSKAPLLNKALSVNWAMCCAIVNHMIAMSPGNLTGTDFEALNIPYARAKMGKEYISLKTVL